jgi:organic hydroperoxide reductase OsmC/OhrA
MNGVAHDAHEYHTVLTWSGSTAVGYDAYERTHDVVSPPAPDALTVSADPAFRGDPARGTPEQLLLAAAAAWPLLAFLAVAARARIDVLSYRDEGWAEMPLRDGPMAVERIVLRPVIEVVEGPPLAKIERLVEVAHRECFIANSLRVEPEVLPTITFVPAAP